MNTPVHPCQNNERNLALTSPPRPSVSVCQSVHILEDGKGGAARCEEGGGVLYALDIEHSMVFPQSWDQSHADQRGQKFVNCTFMCCTAPVAPVFRLIVPNVAVDNIKEALQSFLKLWFLLVFGEHIEKVHPA